MDLLLRSYQDAVIIRNVVARVKEAMEFPTEKARRKYLHEHPDADPKNHTVKKPSGKEKKPTSQAEESLKKRTKHLITSDKSTRKMLVLKNEIEKNRHQDVSKAQQAMREMVTEGKKSVSNAEAAIEHLESLPNHDTRDVARAKVSLKKLKDAIEDHEKFGHGLAFTPVKALADTASELQEDLHMALLTVPTSLSRP